MLRFELCSACTRGLFIKACIHDFKFGVIPENPVRAVTSFPDSKASHPKHPSTMVCRQTGQAGLQSNHYLSLLCEKIIDHELNVYIEQQIHPGRFHGFVFVYK